MKVYIVAITSGAYMAPALDTKVYKRKAYAQRKCDQLNAAKPTGRKFEVLCADNWHKEE